jgi:cysteine synthase A
MLFENILGTIGRTPMVKINRMISSGSAQVYCKLESFNPMQSVKDRVALSMVMEAERTGDLKEGMTIVEATSGNTGIGLAMVCAARGYRLVLTMPETMSMERKKLLKALGANLILTSGPEGMERAVTKAMEICENDPNHFLTLQFDNPANPKVHEETTAQEILGEFPDLDAFVSTVGTGGTITGVGRALRARGLKTLIIAVEPADSPVLSGGLPGQHNIQGIGAGFVPKILDIRLIDRIMTVKEEDAISTARELARKEGILAGTSSGAALWAALRIAEELGEGKTLVVELPDTGERYLSTGLFD